MKKFPGLVLALALCLALAAQAALAKRLGGGGSFGGRTTYSSPYRSTGAPTYAPTSPSQPTQQQAAPQQTPLGQQGTGLGGGMGSRMGWGLGGLFAGGLLGSMLFGRGMGGGFGLLDLLILGLVVYFVLRLLRGRRGSPSGSRQDGWQAPPPGASSDPPPTGQTPTDPRSRAAQSWDALRSGPEKQAQPGQNAATGGFGVAAGSEPLAGPAVPEGFNVPEFLEGAKTVYARLQHSWDRRDLNDIALFTTPEVLSEIRRQAAADPAPSKTEILLVNAKLLEFREEGQDIVTTVLFDVLLREDAGEDRPKQVREVWHFSRPAADAAVNWRLEGIQQLEG